MKTDKIDEIKDIFDYEFTTRYCDMPVNWKSYIDDYASETVSELLEKIDSRTLITLLTEMLKDKKHELNIVVEDAVNYGFTDEENWEDYQHLLKSMIREIKDIKI